MTDGWRSGWWFKKVVVSVRSEAAAVNGNGRWERRVKYKEHSGSRTDKKERSSPGRRAFMEFLGFYGKLAGKNGGWGAKEKIKNPVRV